MLKINLKKKSTDSLKELVFSDIYISPDLTFLSFVTDKKYDLHNNDKLLYLNQFGKISENEIKTEDFIAYGEIFVENTYEVHELENENGAKYITFSDNQYLFNRYEFNLGKQLGNNKIYIDDDTYYEISGNTVSIREKYYLTDENLVLKNGEEYSVNLYTTFKNSDTSNIERHVNLIPIDDTFNPRIFADEDVVLYDFPKTYTKVYVYDLNDRELNVKDIYCYGEKETITYHGITYDVATTFDGGGEEIKYVTNIGNGYSGSTMYEFEGEEYNDVGNIHLNDMDVSICPISISKLVVDSGRNCAMVINDSDLTVDDTIIAKCYSTDGRELKVFDTERKINKINTTTNAVVCNGGAFYETTLLQYNDNTYHPYDFLVIGDNEYQITYTNNENTQGYVIYEGNALNFVFETKKTPNDSSFFTELSDVKINEADMRKTLKITNDVKLDYKTYCYQDSEKTEKYTYSGYFNVINNNKEERIVTDVVLNNDGDKCFLFAHRIMTENVFNVAYSSLTSSIITLLNQPFYAVHRYNFIDINGNKHKILFHTLPKEDSGETLTFIERYIYTTLEERYELRVKSVDGGSTINCEPIIGKYDLNFFERTYNGEYLENPYENIDLYTHVCSEIVNNRKKYKFYKKIKSFEDLILNDRQCYGYLPNYHSKINHFYKNGNFYEIPIYIQQDEANNMLQEDMLTNEFYNIENTNAINRIVDMERDIYYPTYLSDGKVEDGDCVATGDFLDINKIIFKLHFRTRELTNWNINNDITQDATNNDSSFTNTLERGDGVNWFSVDYYMNNKNLSGNTLLTNIMNSSDLLSFLNFTDDDIFYQKSKVGKSFLRLLFYDTNDPTDQKLLYSATVWMDENKLYKKYINNIEYNSYEKNSITNYYYDIVSDMEKGEQISVSGEPCNYSAKTTPNFNSDCRLDATFEIENRYETANSSEGFYLHMFKELSNGLYTKTIYLKVQFNHAGEGKSITFMLPTKNGSLITFDNTSTVKKDIEYLCSGSTMLELYDKMFIPIKIKYDIKTNKFVWFLPSNLIDKNGYNDGKMTFNLFEIKLKDESF